MANTPRAWGNSQLLSAGMAYCKPCVGSCVCVHERVCVCMCHSTRIHVCTLLCLHMFSYEKAKTHHVEVPRMLLDDPLELENYVMKSKDR